MAKANNNFPISGSLGDVSIFKVKGIDKLVVRAKGGPSKHKIKNDPVFEKVRLNNTEFGGCARAAGKIMRSLLYIKYLGDHNFTGTLAKISRIIQRFDSSGIIGQRSILFSEHKNIMSGFNLNKENVFDSVVNNSFAYYFTRSEYKVTVFIPELYPKINILNPWGLGWYRLVIVLGVIPDMEYTQYGYQQTNEMVIYNPVKFGTEWLATSLIAKERIVNLQLAAGTFVDESASMVISIGIEFGRMVTDSIIEPVKNAGCAKILGVG